MDPNTTFNAIFIVALEIALIRALVARMFKDRADGHVWSIFRSVPEPDVVAHPERYANADRRFVRSLGQGVLIILIGVIVGRMVEAAVGQSPLVVCFLIWFPAVVVAVLYWYVWAKVLMYQGPHPPDFPARPPVVQRALGAWVRMRSRLRWRA